MRTLKDICELPDEALVTKQEARTVYVGCGTTKFWELEKFDPTFPEPVMLGSKAMLRVGSIKQWVASLPPVPDKRPPGRPLKTVALSAQRASKMECA